MIRLGLTGSIGMGKSATAAHFAAHGDAVIDADALVHRLYAGAAAPLIEAAFPGTTREGVVDRPALRARVLNDDTALKRLEAIVHPLVRAEEARAADRAAAEGRRIAVFDIPLLLETGRAADFRAVVVVHAPADVQRARLLARPGMTEETLAAILARQMPSDDKVARAHFVVDTAHGHAHARATVAAIRRALFAIG
ncbi:MAG: dephospho-CoA kinase [Pseudomonadota bacterium]